MTEPQFERTNFAQVMREIFIHEMNRVPERIARSDAFWRAQQKVSKLRSKLEHAYAQQSSREPNFVELWQFGMLAYQKIVGQNKRAEDVIGMSNKKLIEQAREVMHDEV